MLNVSYRGLPASFSLKALRWVSDVPEFAKILNGTLDLETLVAVGNEYREGGLEGMALKRAKKHLGQDLRVVLFDAEDGPETETKGVVT